MASDKRFEVISGCFLYGPCLPLTLAEKRHWTIRLVAFLVFPLWMFGTAIVWAPAMLLLMLFDVFYEFVIEGGR